METLRDKVRASFPLVESPWFDTLVHTITDPVAKRLAADLHENGYAVIDFPEPELDACAAAIEEALAGHLDLVRWRSGAAEAPRIQDAWVFDAHVRRLACNETVRNWLSAIFGREAFPFQTLNFRVGSEQSFHSDSVHFSSCPERFMCGVWLALEDIDADNGPLTYYPGSHAWPIYTPDHFHIDVRAQEGLYDNYRIFEELWQDLAESRRAKSVTFTPRKGQALIWLANLLHGGMPHRDKSRTRWSQVTHYYFEGCSYYTPLGTNFFQSTVELREPPNIVNETPHLNHMAGRTFTLQSIDPRWHIRPNPIA